MGKNIELNDLSKFRTELMGFSTLLILICHSIAYVEMPRILYYGLSLGNLGVDLFLFLSGMGMWYSISNYSRSEIHWYCDRYKKLFIPYLVSLLPLEFVQFALGKQLEHGIANWLFGITSLRFYVSHNAAWFIAALIPLYLFAPIFYKFIRLYHWKASIFLIILHYIILVIPLDFSSDLVNNICSNIQFVAIRATCFILGMALGKYIKEKKTISVLWLLGLIAVGVVAVIITRHFVYGYFYFTLPLLYLFIYIIKHCCMQIGRFARFMGTISLESYIINGVLPKLLISLFVWLKLPVVNNLLPYLLSCVLGLLLGYVFHKISEKIL